MLTEEDWRWIIEVCSKTRPQPGEERHPDEWTGSTESISSVLPRWRRFMRAKHPYTGFMIERSTIGRRARCKDKRYRIPGRNPDDDSKPEGQDVDQEETTEMNQNAGNDGTYDVDSEGEAVDQ
ncbi:hypothetical protein V3481_016624 [Fusarium oxysporum f. sp. vasinfectum]|uniref:Uncharacterized protein n=1 Tax=Fusarium oxysporum f. sp. vasinfectum 25433 TaxID=1089449 RepID=X0MJD3_FUSOX|nr:hypothetical protein FOTG_11338 [Fusarium oxysporum f. sp. vasinfectum 25433]KAK2689308.1 hypothetical protein QWA68_011424 [Fusarium oxysporum]